LIASPALSLAQDTPAIDAMNFLLNKVISGVPVVDDEGKITAAIYHVLRMCTRSHASLTVVAQAQEYSTLAARDMMTSPALSLSPDTPVIDAMNFLVNKAISGVPVVDDEGKVLGVCSGYDLLALDSTPGRLDKSCFPPVDTCIDEFGGDRKAMWSNFKQLRQKLNSAGGSTGKGVCYKRQFQTIARNRYRQA
jgi:CBS domain-containing protein